MDNVLVILVVLGFVGFFMGYIASGSGPSSAPGGGCIVLLAIILVGAGIIALIALIGQGLGN